MKNIIIITFFLISTFALRITGHAQNDVNFNIINTCPDAETGSVELTVEWGAPPYLVEWTDENENLILTEEVSNSSKIENLASGRYCVTVISIEEGCYASTCDIIVEELGPSIESITPICICDYGSAELEVSGGSGDYSYSWGFWMGTYSNEETPVIIHSGFGNGPETHTVTVTDNQTGCQATASTEVGYCTGIGLAQYINVTPDCNAEGTSTITMQLPSGIAVGPFEYRWTKVGFGLVEFDPSTDGIASLENAEPGEYCLNLRTMNGCDETVCGIIVKNMPAPTLTYTISSNGGNSWTLSTIVASSGPGPFTYLWDDVNQSTTPAITVNGIGTYNVTVTDAVSSCTAVAVIKMVSCSEIDQALSLPNQIEAIVTPIFSGGSLGAIDITNVADQFPGYDFNYIWNNGKTTEYIDGLSAGTYRVTITSDDCNFSPKKGQWTVCGFSVGFEVYPFSNSCDLGDLHLNITPSDNYSIQWAPPVATSQANSLNVSAEYGVEHCVTISQGFAPNQCQATACFTPQPPPIQIELVNLENALYGLPTGVIEVDANVGVFSNLYDLTYAWSNGGDGPEITGLIPGEYTVTVTDDCGNSATATYRIQCELLESDIEAIVTNAFCSSSTGGSINLTTMPFFGVPDPVYTFSWSNGAQTEDISGLNAGQYCVTIVEASTGCVAFDCFEISAIGEGAFTINFDMQPGCWPLSQGQITANPSNPALGPFEYYWYNYNWSTGQTQNLGNTATLTNVPANWYSVIVTDAMGCTASNYTLMWPAYPSFFVAPLANPLIVCDGETATGKVQITSGNPIGPLTYTWANNSQYPITPISTGTLPMLEGMEPGNWSVTVTSGNGCQAFTHNLKVQEALIKVKSEITEACGKGSIKLTPVVSQWLPANPPFSYLWSDGSTEQNRNNLEAGTYCVTITDAMDCESVECFEVNPAPAETLLISSIVEDNGCKSQCSGSIELTTNPAIVVDIDWEDGNFFQPHKRSFLCPGEYTATITSVATGCEEVHTFTVGQAGQEVFEYEVEVLYYFGNEVNISGNAVVNIQSELFEFPGQVSVFSSSQMTPPAIVTHSVSNPNAFNTSISENFSNVDPFHFKYTAPNGCVYTGSFPGIPTCDNDPVDHFNFQVNHVGSNQGDCGPNQAHTYTLSNVNMGQNFPYFLEVTMVDAYSPNEASYGQIIEFNSTVNSITVNGVPAGTVQFKTYNKCDNVIFLRTHVNCCGTLSCDAMPINQGTGSQFGGYQYWDFPYFRLQAEKSLGCFDKCGDDWFEEDCSRVTLLFDEGDAPEFNCWTGTVTITYPDGPNGVFEVLEDNPRDKKEWISGPKGWSPDEPGTYEISISYVGSGANSGENCIKEILINYFGNGNYNEALVFLDDHWYIDGLNIPQIFKDAYFAVQTCQDCKAGENYYFNINNCESSGNYQIQYFEFVPTYYGGADPCQSGGTLTFLDFDANGIPTVQTATIPPNSAVASLPDQYPLFNVPEGYGCKDYGWCLFDANLGLDPIYDVPVDQPLLASYGFCAQTSYPDPDDNPNPCQTDSDCWAGFDCDPTTGNCYLPCTDYTDCPPGQDCNEAGQCVPNGDCITECPSGFHCEEGECYLNEGICGFYVSVNGQGGENTYPFYHDNVPAGTTYTYILNYKTYYIPDKFEISHNGQPIGFVDCTKTEGNWEEYEFHLTGGGDIVIEVSSIYCDGGKPISKFEFEVTCDEQVLNAPPTNNLVCGNSLDANGIVLDPNPFSDNLNLTTDAIVPFSGEIMLNNYMGMNVANKSFEFTTGSNNLTLEGLGSLPPSIYSLSIRRDGEVCLTKQVVKL